MNRHPTTKRRVSIWDLRRLFNEGGVIKKLRRGELVAESVKCTSVAPNSSYIGQTIPVGSISQILALYDGHNNKVVEIHRYIKPDGAIGGSGKNDPKRLRIGNTIFHQEKPNQPEARLSNKEINRILDKRGLAAMMTYLQGWKGKLRYLRFRITGK